MVEGRIVSDTSAVLARIDDTLAGSDGTVSREGGDAMRWSPGRVICDRGKPLRIGRRPPVGPWAASLDPEQVSRAIAAFAGVAVSMQQAREALSAFARALSKSMERFGKSAHGLSHQRRHVRCRGCNPAGNPMPLAIDGREYHRRQLARRRRRR